MQILCVGRHPYLSEHFGRYFSGPGIGTSCVTGLELAIVHARAMAPDVVLCDYDILATLPLDAWENDDLLGRTPVIAVSLTRRPDEVNLLDVNSIGGFLYLPSLAPGAALKILSALATRKKLPPVAGSPVPLLPGTGPHREYELR